MDRKDLTLSQIKTVANSYFNTVGTGQGTGYKQYQRWLYEREFHTDANGYFISPELEYQALKDFRRTKLRTRGTTQTWQELGPQAWSYTSSWNPGVGRITSVAIHPSDTTVILVSSPGGGIWRSKNSGQTWKPLTDFTNTTIMNVFHLGIDPSNKNTIYASTGSGLYKTLDTGNTWVVTGSGPSNVKQVKVHPQNSAIVFAAAGNGMWRSTNSGTSWTSVESSGKEDIEFNPTDPNIMYASNSSGTCVWRSTNNGVSWSAIGTTSGITNSGRTLLAVSAQNPSRVYAVQANGSIFGRMYVSNDTGKTYSTSIVGNSTAGTNFFGYTANGTGTTGQASYDMAICANPVDANEVHIAGIICWKSTNAGSSFVVETEWSYPNGTGYNHADVHALEWIGKTIYSGSDGGIYKSTNHGDDWTDLSSGLGIRQFYRMSCSKTDANVITTGAQDNGSSFRRSNGAWVDWLGADGMDNSISPTNANIAIGTSQNGSIYRTTNAGASYSGLTKPSNGNWVTPLVMHPTNHDTIWGGWTGVWRSVNNGTNWTNISTGITSMIDVINVAPSNTKYIYASDNNILYRTTNGGATWSSSTAPSSISSIFVSEKNPAKIWISCNSSSARVYVSTDTGVTFTNLSSGLPALNARSVVVNEDWNETIYVGMNVGVYYRDTNMTTWLEHGTGLPLVGVNEVEIQKSGKKLRVATYGRGIWESPLQNIPETCPKPTNLTTSSITVSSGFLKWNQEAKALNYTVEYRKASVATWTVLSSSTTDTFASLSGLNSETQYVWRVRSNCSLFNGSFDSAIFTTLILCDSPTGLTQSNITKTSAFLTWSNAAGSLSFRLEYKKTADALWTLVGSSIADTFFALTGLTAETSYQWRVRSNCTSISSPYSPSSFTTSNDCVQVINLEELSITTNSVFLRWSRNINALSYRLEYKKTIDATWTIKATALTDTFISIFGLDESTDYEWRLRCDCNMDTSIYETSTFSTLKLCYQPVLLKVDSVTASKVNLSWSSAKNAMSYRLEYKLNSSPSWILASSTLIDTFYNLTGLSISSTYNWRVRSNCGFDSSVYNVSLCSTLGVCDSPSVLVAKSTTSSSSVLTWNPAFGANTYQLEYKLATSANWIVLAINLVDTFYVLNSLNYNAQYDWRVKSNCINKTSPFVNSSFKTNMFCGTPMDLKVKLVNLNSVDLSWAAVPGALDYTIEYRKSSSSTWSPIATTSNLVVNLTSLTGGSYDWRVRANCSQENSFWVSSKFSIYCDVSGLSSSNTFIDEVTLGKMNRRSGNDGGFFDASNLSEPIKPGNTHTLTVSPGFSGPLVPTYWTIGIDYNQDGDFLDSREMVGQFSYHDQFNYVHNFIVPNAIILGKTKMRVAVSTAVKFPSLCGTINSGEVEDYSVELKNTPDISALNVVDSKNSLFNVYPNPANDNITLVYNLDQHDYHIVLKIIDISGKLIHLSISKGQKGDNTVEFNLSKYSNGIYFLHLESDEGTKSRSFVIEK